MKADYSRDPPTTIAQSLNSVRARLSTLPNGSPGLEAEVLLAHILDKPRTHLIAWPDKALSTEQQAGFQALVQRRLQGEPLAYLTGRREFWSLSLRVTPATLIPRPETEQLVERALELIPKEARAQIVDLGTGSGAIAAAIATERPLASIIATDFDSAALAVARENFRHLDLNNVTCLSGEWCAALPDQRWFDMILSNPPYVAEGDSHLQQDGLPWEPVAALTGGPDGLRAIRNIIRQTPACLKPGGWLILEHGFEQGAAVWGLLRRQGFREVSTLQDLAHRDRLSEGRLTLPT
jgi:release factor glutamine methyltransferase